MPAYMIADITITDPEAYAEYRAQVPSMIEQCGGRYLARGGDVFVGEGDWQPGRMVILEFDDVAAAKAFYNGPEYAPHKALRQSASTGSVDPGGLRRGRTQTCNKHRFRLRCYD